MAAGSVALALVAGVLSILSPCVLPILPIVLGAAASEHRWGPLLLAAGLAVSFVAIGLFVATIGFSIGWDADIFRKIAAAVMIVIGSVLLVPRFQARLALAGDLSQIGATGSWAPRGRAAWAANCQRGCCSARFGAPVSARHSRRRRSSRRKAAISGRSQQLCSPSDGFDIHAGKLRQLTDR
jgi:cytochrome c-type biogenesis protein